jgi:hypothetical protein
MGAHVLLQAGALLGPGHLAQLDESHLQTRSGDVGEIQIKLFCESPELPVHADGNAKRVGQPAFAFRGGHELGQGIGLKLGSGFQGDPFPAFAVAGGLRTLE